MSQRLISLENKSTPQPLSSVTETSTVQTPSPTTAELINNPSRNPQTKTLEENSGTATRRRKSQSFNPGSLRNNFYNEKNPVNITRGIQSNESSPATDNKITVKQKQNRP